MKKDDVISVVKYLGGGSRVCRDSGEHWLLTNCLLAPYTHGSGSDRKPSMAISHGQGQSVFTCFTCAKSGSLLNLVKLLVKYEKKDYSQLLAKVEQLDHAFVNSLEDSLLIDERPPQPANEALYMSAFDEALNHEAAIAYLQGRGISNNTAFSLNLRYDPEAQRILFPVYGKDSKFYGFSGRAITNHPEIPRIQDYANLPKKQLFLGMQFFEKGRPIVLVEGLFAWAHLIEIGALNFCTPLASLGVKVTKYKLDLLAGFGEPICICFDPDRPGQEAADSIVMALKDQAPVYKFNYPEHRQDVDDLTLQELLSGFATKKTFSKVIW